MDDKTFTVSKIMRCVDGCADMLEAIEYNLGTGVSADRFKGQVECLRKASALMRSAILDGEDYPMHVDEDGIVRVGGAQKEVKLTSEQAEGIKNLGLFGN